MKKQYIKPVAIYCELDLECILAGSPIRWEGNNANEDQETVPGFEYVDDGNGDGMND